MFCPKQCASPQKKDVMSISVILILSWDNISFSGRVPMKNPRKNLSANSSICSWITGISSCQWVNHHENRMTCFFRTTFPEVSPSAQFLHLIFLFHILQGLGLMSLGMLNICLQISVRDSSPIVGCFFIETFTPGKRLHNYGKSPFWMLYKWAIFNSFLYVCQGTHPRFGREKKRTMESHRWTQASSLQRSWSKSSARLGERLWEIGHGNAMGIEWGDNIRHYLVGGLEHFVFSHILGIIIPTD